MAIEFKPRAVAFTQPATKSVSVDFGNTVRSGGAAIQGMALTFGDDDNKVRDMNITIRNVVPNGTYLEFDVVFNLVDDDDHSGKGDITVLAMADVEGR